MRSIALASVAVPTVERGLAPIRCWSTRMAVVNPSRRSTSGRASVGMKPCTKALYVSLISRWDSAAIVPNTSELLPEPETPVNTVSRRFGISTLTSLRLFTRAPYTRIRSWLSAACGAGGRGSVLVAMLIGCLHRSGGPGARSGPASPGLIRKGLHAGSARGGAEAPARRRGRRTPGRGGRSSVLQQPEDVAVRVGDGGHETAAADVVGGLVHLGAGGGDLGELRLDVGHVPVGDRRGHALRPAAGDQPDVLAGGLEADVVGRVALRRRAEQRRVHRLGRGQVG